MKKIKFSSYLEKSLDVFVKQQRAFSDQMEAFIENAPKSIFTDIAEQNLELWQSMQNNFFQAFAGSKKENSKTGSDGAKE